MITSFDGKYSFLSNFYAAQTLYNGVLYPTSEHAYQAAKVIEESDKIKIFMCATPDEAKHLGRKIKIREDWDDIKDQVMYDIVKAKFSNPFLAKKLINTGNEILCEGNYWHDNYWGVCNCPICKITTHPHKNTLGKILMQVREELKNN